MNSLRLLILVWLFMLAGCDARPPKKFARAEDLERYAALPRATATHDSNLRAEVARVAAEGGTPAQLAGWTSDKPPATKRSNDSIVVHLQDIFPSEICEKLGPRLQSVYPTARFQFAPFVRGTARELMLASEDRCADFQRLMLSAELPPIYPHEHGMGADLSYLSAIEVGSHLAGIQLADMLESDRLVPAVEVLDTMFRACEWLAREKHPTPRLVAVQKRREALNALGAIARHPQASSGIYGKLLEIMDRQISQWPPDAHAWIGERAEGLHTYELVRDGYLLSLLSFEKLRRWRDEIGIEKLGMLVGENIDGDELFFLTTMRHTIAACELPFHARSKHFKQVEEDFERLRRSDNYPFVADQLLPARLAERQRSIAFDQARCLAWQIALTVALGREPDATIVNPVTGQTYSVLRVADTVSIDGIGDDEPAIEVARLVR